MNPLACKVEPLWSDDKESHVSHDWNVGVAGATPRRNTPHPGLYDGVFQTDVQVPESQMPPLA
jgi:hypothetical protein